MKRSRPINEVERRALGDLARIGLASQHATDADSLGVAYHRQGAFTVAVVRTPAGVLIGVAKRHPGDVRDDSLGRLAAFGRAVQLQQDPIVLVGSSVDPAAQVEALTSAVAKVTRDPFPGKEKSFSEVPGLGPQSIQLLLDGGVRNPAHLWSKRRQLFGEREPWGLKWRATRALRSWVRGLVSGPSCARRDAHRQAFDAFCAKRHPEVSGAEREAMLAGWEACHHQGLATLRVPISRDSVELALVPIVGDKATVVLDQLRRSSGLRFLGDESYDGGGGQR